MSLRHLLLIFLILPTFIFGNECERDLSGAYRVRGFDPATNAEYIGTALFFKDNEVYHIVWSFSDQTSATGTGVLHDGCFAAIFHESAGPTGVRLYKIKGKTLSGPWTRLGTNETGCEILKKTLDLALP